jgi:hypothetical protein
MKMMNFQGFGYEQTAYIQICHVWHITVCICFASTGTGKSVLDDGLKNWLSTNFINKM